MRGIRCVIHQATAGVRRSAAVVLALAAAGCWPAPGQGPDRTAHNPFEDTITPETVATLAPIWTATTDSAEGRPDVVGPAVVSYAGVHVRDAGSLYGFDKRTGARLWRSPGEPVAIGTVGDPIAELSAGGDRVLSSFGVQVGYSGSWSGDATWLDARTGDPLETVGDGPVLARRSDHLVTWSAAGSSLFVFQLWFLDVVDTTDPTGGWSGTFHTGGGSSGPPPTIGADRLYLAGEVATSFTSSAFTGVRAYPLTRPQTCVESPGWPYPDVPIPCPLWSTLTAARPVTSPVIGGGGTVLYVGTEDGTLLALDAGDGHELWRADLGAAPSADPALADGRLYVPLTDGELAVVPADGCGHAECGAAWRADLGGAAVQPAVAGGVVFVGTDAGQALAFAADGCGGDRCQPLWQRDMGGPVTGAPAVSSGRLYLGVAPNRLVALAPD